MMFAMRAVERSIIASLVDCVFALEKWPAACMLFAISTVKVKATLVFSVVGSIIEDF